MTDFGEMARLVGVFFDPTLQGTLGHDALILNAFGEDWFTYPCTCDIGSYHVVQSEYL